MDAQEVIPPTYRTGHITQAQWLAILAGLDETGRAGLSAALAALGSPQSVTVDFDKADILALANWGQVLDAEVAFGGADYAVGDTGLINGGDGTAAYAVLTESAGRATSVAITSPGINYAKDSGGSTTTTASGAQPGIGSNLVLKITETSQFVLVPAPAADIITFPIACYASAIGNVTYKDGQYLNVRWDDYYDIFVHGGTAALNNEIDGSILTEDDENRTGQSGPRNNSFSSNGVGNYWAAGRPVTLQSSAAYTEITNAIGTSTIGAAGANFAEYDTIQIDGGNAVIRVLTINNSGGVTAYEFVGRGQGYSIASGVSTTATGGSNGSGFTLNITGLAVSDQKLRVTTLFIQRSIAP